MTLFLIVLIIFLCVWFSDSAKKKEIQEEKKKWENTNIPLQDKLEKEYLIKVISDIKNIDKEKRTGGYDLIEELESLYNNYDIPFQSSAYETPEKFRVWLQNGCSGAFIIKSETSFSIEEEIFGIGEPHPFITHPDLLFGVPKSRVWYDADGNKLLDSTLFYKNGTTRYDYDSAGRLQPPWCQNVVADAIGKLVDKLVKRDLFYQGYAYSGSRKSTQQTKEDKQYLKKVKNDNPWLFSPPEKDQKNSKK